MTKIVCNLLLASLLTSAGIAQAQQTQNQNQQAATASSSASGNSTVGASTTTAAQGQSQSAQQPTINSTSAQSLQQMQRQITGEAPPIEDSQVLETGLTASYVFGQWLFQGKFAQSSFKGFNPDYLVGTGDIVDLKLWGAFTLQLLLEVDAQGNIFVPQVGPVQVANVRNAELNNVVQARIKAVYREDVGVYASLAGSQPVKVFVSGSVLRPGLYDATSSDSLLHFLDLAGGIDPRAGSYLDVRVIRGGTTVREISLYDFLLNGTLPQIQFRDGDSLFVGPIRSTAVITGLIARPAQFEFDSEVTLARILKMAGINERATNVRITSNQGSRRNTTYFSLSDDLDHLVVRGGDEIEVLADRLLGNIGVSVEGEHDGGSQYVLAYRSTLKDLLDQVQFAPTSRRDSLQLFRKSIADRQKQVLDQMLGKLEESVLSARSATKEEADLRAQEAELVLQFVEKAKLIRPKGQLVLPKDVDPSLIALEDGDVIRIPRTSNVVAVHGEVFLPNAFLYNPRYDAADYIREAGGMTQAAGADRILVMQSNGQVKFVERVGIFSSTTVGAGDEVLVLPKVDEKKFQLGKDIIEVIYQIAIAAGVVLRL